MVAEGIQRGGHALVRGDAVNAVQTADLVVDRPSRADGLHKHRVIEPGVFVGDPFSLPRERKIPRGQEGSDGQEVPPIKPDAVRVNPLIQGVPFPSLPPHLIDVTHPLDEGEAQPGGKLRPPGQLVKTGIRPVRTFNVDRSLNRPWAFKSRMRRGMSDFPKFLTSFQR